jgi:hypothetical protein
MLPSKARDQWYMEHAKELNTIKQIKVGMTKEQVLTVAGEPTRKRTENVLHEPVDEWIYTHPHFQNKDYIKFEGGKVVSFTSH